MKSLRQTILVRVTVLLTIISVITAMTSYFLVKREANKFLDAQLAEIAKNVGEPLQANVVPKLNPEIEDRLVVQVWNRSGPMVHVSGPDTDLPRQASEGYFNAVASSGAAWRVFQASDGEHVVQVSHRWSAREEIANRAAMGAALPFIAAVPLMWLLVGASIDKILRGLGNLSADIGRRSIEAKDPLSPDAGPIEVAPLIDAMNSLIVRHQDARKRQRRFISDAAHELRTPLAALQLQVDNLEIPDGSGAVAETLAELRDGIARGARLVGQLLSLARAESPPVTIEQEVIVIDELVRTLVGDFFPLLEANGLTISIIIDEQITVKTSRSDLELLLRILMENAASYTPSGGAISISCEQIAQRTSIEITDSGCGIAEAVLPFIFDRFFRAAPPDVPGTGLGLAIAKAIADRNHFALSVRNRSDAPGVIASIELS